MALSRSRTNELPKDALVISEEQAFAYQWKIVSSWEPSREVWSLRYAPGLLGAMSAMTGVFVNNHYRNKLRLGNYGRLSTYLPIVVIPAMFSVLAHKFFVQRSVILNPLSECPLCVQVRAASLQCGVGVCYPTVLAPLAAFMFATRHFTYRLPTVTQEPLEVVKLWRKLTRPILPTLGVMLAAQAFAAMYLVYKESDQSFRVQLKMQQIEQSVEQEQQHLAAAAQI